MREILFRGKSNWSYGNVKEGDWLYGMTISRHVYNDEEITSYYIGGGNNTIYGNTLGQYTGLTDKNGKKIFEGDIITAYVYEREWENEYLSNTPIQVEYVCGYFYPFHLEGCWRSGVSDIEIIGNIHDNPELLKGGEKK